MVWIRVIDENAATGKLKQLYEENREPWGGVDNILKIHSLATDGLEAHLALYRNVMHAPGDLSRRQREMIAVVVSALNHCAY